MPILGLRNNLTSSPVIQTAGPAAADSYHVTFDGGQDYLQLGVNYGDEAPITFVYDEDFSIAAWIYLNEVDAANTIFSSGNSSTYLSLSTISGGKILFKLDNKLSVSSTSLSADTWYHVVATYSGKGGATAGDGIKLYVDNVSKTVNLTYTNTYVDMEDLSQALTLGTRKDVSAGSSTYLDGKLDDVSLWDKSALLRRTG